jgi:hypothetical protein
VSPVAEQGFWQRCPRHRDGWQNRLVSPRGALPAPNLQAQLSVSNGRAAVDFYKAAFDAVEVYRFGGTDEPQEVVAQLAVGSCLFCVEDSHHRTGTSAR